MTATSARSKPIRAATSRAMVSPATEWSPGQPLPMSCSRAATSSRSGRPTRRVSAEARTAVSTRWRSTVQVCTGLRCGRQRTRSQSGSSRVIRPSASSASQTGDGGLPRAEQGDELLAGLGGPGHGQRPGGGGEPAYGVQGERQPGLGGGGGGPQRQHGVAFGAGGAGEHHLAVLLDDALGERAALGLRRRGRRPAGRAAGAARTRARSTRSTSRQVTSVAYETVRAAS